MGISEIFILVLCFIIVVLIVTIRNKQNKLEEAEILLEFERNLNDKILAKLHKYKKKKYNNL